MNRRDFLKTLAGLVALPLMKPEVPKSDYSPSLEAIKAFSKTPSSIFEGIRMGLAASGDALLEQTKPVVEAMAGRVGTTVYFTPYLGEGAVAWNGETWARLISQSNLGLRQRLFDEYHQNYLEVREDENT